MNQYVATFYTHYAAMRAQRALAALGCHGELRPVPRTLSASCGTCLFYQADEDCAAALGRDAEAVYRVEGGGYRLEKRLS